MKYVQLNEIAWDNHVKNKYEWTLPISHESFLEAKNGVLKMFLTPTVIVPEKWFSKLNGSKVLGLASGGGQQGPIFVAHGADTTIFDLSDKQIDSERMVAERENYSINVIKGDMTKSFPFSNETFDLIFNPVSNCYVKEIQTIWKECARVLKKGGILMTGFVKEEKFMFEPDFQNENILISRHSLPFNPLTDLPDEKLKTLINNKETLSFSHSLTEQIGGQLKAGFTLTDIYEDGDGGGLFDRYMKSYVAVRMVKV